MCPCTRICGGVSVVMWRSDPLLSTSVLSSSGSVAIVFRAERFANRLLHRLARDFFDRGDAFHHLQQAAPAQRDHPVVDRLAPELERRGADEDQLADLLGDFHHLVEADASAVAGVVVAVAPAALLLNHLLLLFRPA